MPRPSETATSDALGVVTAVLAPLVARGLIVRRPWVESFLERVDADRRATLRLRALTDRYGPAPLPVRVLGREIALVLTPEDAHHILAGPAEQFLVATREKKAALRRFQPHGVLASAPAARPVRRHYNEQILETDQPCHSLADAIAAKAADEAAQMLARARTDGLLAWDTFAHHWWRLVLRIVLGDHAQNDQRLVDQLTRLRRDANWAQFAPHHAQLRRAFQCRLHAHLREREPGSLAALMGRAHPPHGTFAGEQVPQWLFAFDGAGMATFRMLALIDAHSEPFPQLHRQPVLSPAESVALMRPTVLESLRLWPTTPAILRETTTESTRGNRTLPAHTTMLIYSPFFHRDPQQTPKADAFAPEHWPDGQPDPPWAFPFSAGHAACPGRQLVTLICSTVVTHLLQTTPLRQAHPNPLRSDQPLPGTLSPFRLRFQPALRPET